MSEQDVFDALMYRIVVDEHGTRRYYNKDNRLHRTNGPAVEWNDGEKWWYQNGQRHRTDGPAVERFDRYREWWQHGQRHRTDGPAVVGSNGHKAWFINGEEMTEAEFNQKVKDYE